MVGSVLFAEYLVKQCCIIIVNSFSLFQMHLTEFLSKLTKLLIQSA